MVGYNVGSLVGFIEGSTVGMLVGLSVGASLGGVVGSTVGSLVGTAQLPPRQAQQASFELRPFLSLKCSLSEQNLSASLAYHSQS